MMLKKQTVWLLTMLSLVVVLSVYYITAEPTNNNNLANVDVSKEEKADSKKVTEKEKSSDTKNTTITDAKNEVFEEIRLQMQDERSKKLEQLEEVAGSTDLSAEERSEAKDEMNRLQKIAEKETFIENLIIQTLGYEDALVQADESEVLVTVKGEEPSKAKANEIIKIVKKEMGNSSVTVAFQSENETK
ncbi:SpoIIIAH-like family protein [Caldibacillus thermoamylovorans]|uniref:SpoIIIAH-like family protein n=1 Tax=Bacillaceae TaxID=186817 RepID=UPI000D55FCD0|nr:MULTISPECIES: SpoIIIAH-like family protein [Bacillaceae]AWI12820.1 stage III sporulation protein AH [Caldibacillus thermoamylovorans]MBU5344007.1 SpoIIIAH-like family protein [Caldifermentibacillus hisashii]MCB5933682.1 SpoIIIAH-like family protein [Bacillus sp. DFI.2.34]MCB7077031.1 SpoIIIAH-like family protein [Caldibacillus thermoamylovorans]